MSEAASGTLRIQDTEPVVMEAVIQYIYTSRLPDDADILQIFLIAQKYDLRDLAEHASEKMLADINRYNALERCRAVRVHATANDQLAQDLWRRMYAKIAQDPSLLQEVFEQALS